MIRFFVDSGNIKGKLICLNAEDSEHIRSLRIRPDEEFTVCDGNGTDYLCVLDAANGSGAKSSDISTARITGKKRNTAEPSVNCSVYLAYTKGDRLDFAVQKSVELGAQKIVLFKSERCIAYPSRVLNKVERLRKIAHKAAKQSGRGIIPDVVPIGEFRCALDAAAKDDLAVLFYEEEKNMNLTTVLDHFFSSKTYLKQSRTRIRSVSILTGPEGGFEPSEVTLAHSKGVSVASLGPRILRSETAPVAALSAIMYHTGNL